MRRIGVAPIGRNAHSDRDNPLSPYRDRVRDTQMERAAHLRYLLEISSQAARVELTPITNWKHDRQIRDAPGWALHLVPRVVKPFQRRLRCGHGNPHIHARLTRRFPAVSDLDGEVDVDMRSPA